MKTKETYSMVVEFNYVKIRINGLLHVQFRSDELIGIQSWVNGDNWYEIEYHLKHGKIRSSYCSFDRWRTILNLIDKLKL